jgi:hypothetical protein
MMSKSASKVFVTKFLLGMGAYVIAVIVLVMLINTHPHTTWLHIPLMCIPIVPVLVTSITHKRVFNCAKKEI